MVGPETAPGAFADSAPKPSQANDQGVLRVPSDARGAMVKWEAKMEGSVTSSEVSNRILAEHAGFGSLDSSLAEGAVLWTSGS